LYCTENLEAVAVVKGNVSRVVDSKYAGSLSRFAPLERVRHQRITVTFALMRRVHADQRQVPMRLARVVLRHLLEYRGTIGEQMVMSCSP
jgi:hypothetical protein